VHLTDSRAPVTSTDETHLGNGCTTVLHGGTNLASAGTTPGRGQLEIGSIGATRQGNCSVVTLAQKVNPSSGVVIRNVTVRKAPLEGITASVVPQCQVSRQNVRHARRPFKMTCIGRGA